MTLRTVTTTAGQPIEKKSGVYERQGTTICGISGYTCTGDFDPRLNIALPLLGLMMEKRGNQAWGFTNGEDIWKSVGALSDSFNPDQLGHKTALIHTRWATFGAKTEENSHPFDIGRILGVHNGQIYNHRSVASKYDIKYEVDSELIFHFLNDGRDLSELEGYGAVVFFEDGIIHMGTFNGGSLTLAKTEAGWMWASTKEAVELALRVSGIRLEWFANLKETKLYKLMGSGLAKDERRLTISKQPTYTQSSYKIWDVEKRAWVEEKPKTNAAGIIVSGGVVSGSTSDSRYGQDHWWEGYGDDFGPAWNSARASQQPLLDEPTSDDDEVVDTTPPETCDSCGEILVAKEYGVSAKYGTLCSACLAGSAEMEEDDDVYQFVSYTADDLWKEIGKNEARYLECDDCGYIMVGDELAFREHRYRVTFCEQCYERCEDSGETVLEQTVNAMPEQETINGASETTHAYVVA